MMVEGLVLLPQKAQDGTWGLSVGFACSPHHVCVGLLLVLWFPLCVRFINLVGVSQFLLYNDKIKLLSLPESVFLL